jgi:cysteine desulfurase/selenocysteine lyase
MALVPKTDFEGLETVTHLAAGGETPPLRTQAAALRAWVDVKGRGPAGGTVRADTLARVRAGAAAVFGVTPDEVAIASAADEAMSQAALSLPLEAGDNVVLEDVEFRSASLPWAGLARRGVELRVIRHARWTPAEAAFRAAVDGRTRAVVASQVSYLTGVHHNLEALRAIADGVGAWLVVDATHAAGAVAVPGRLADFTVAATYKWLLGCQGVALLVWNRERVAEVEPAISGWRSVQDGEETRGPLQVGWKPTAERLEPGNPPWPSLFYLEDGLRYLLAQGIERIERHIAPLSEAVNGHLRRMELDVATPADPAFRAGINCFWTADPEGIAARLFADHRVLVSGYSGRVRISTHLYNDEDDLDRLFDALTQVMGARAR